ncbi:MAG: hypothetical protein AB7O96_06740 [Pseudobdellovibrionaceae bacterium]
MKKILCIASFLVASMLTVNAGVQSAQAGWKKVQSETGNHCTDQVRGHLRYLFGNEVNFEKPYSEHCNSGDPNCRYWFKTNLCDGYFVAVNIRGASCSHTHYGFVPIYVTRIWAYGDCKRLMPHDVYPRKDNTEPYIRRKG